MAAPKPTRPCPWCQGREFVVVERILVEVTEYARAFDAITCTTCGHTSFFTVERADLPRAWRVRLPEDGGPYR
jgi:hypothetical protein